MILIHKVKEASAIICDLIQRKALYSTEEALLWENTFIKHQIDKRRRGEPFTINDHIRAMVYSMTSSNRCWRKLSICMDINTGSIPLLDSIFYEYDPYILLDTAPDGIVENIFKNKLGNISTRAQKGFSQRQYTKTNGNTGIT